MAGKTGTKVPKKAGYVPGKGDKAMIDKVQIGKPLLDKAKGKAKGKK